MQQGILALNRVEITEAEIMRCPDMRAAIRLCIKSSGLEAKEVAYCLNIHKEHFSRMFAQSDDPRHFPPELLPKLMDVCHNEIPLIWLALTRNYELRVRKSALELENEQLRREVERLQRDRDVIVGFIREAKP